MNKDEKKNILNVYTEEEKNYFRTLAKDISDARDLLTKPLVEYDDKTYLQQYEDNRKADLAYNPPMEEDDISRTTTGLTREKDNTVHSTLVNLNLKPEINAFDKDQLVIAELGREMEDLVQKSREIEMYDEKRREIYRELVAQGTVYVEETYVEMKVPVGNEENDWDPSKPIKEFKGDEMPIYDIEGKCEAKLHLGKYVLTSSMNEPELQNNMLVATYEEVDRSVAESIYGNWERWDYVPEEVKEEVFNQNHSLDAGSDYIWNTYKVGKGKVGITKVYRRFSNEYMVILNGVMMLPIKFPLRKISPSGLIPIAKGIGEVIPRFRDGKGIPSKTRVDQKLHDIVMRAVVGKAWQSFKPALGNRSGISLSKDIVKPNTITSGIKQGDLFPILPQQLLTITNGDMSILQTIREVINDKSISDSYAGQQTDANTATEVINQNKQTLVKLADMISGVRNLERRLILLRIYNIIANWTKGKEFTYSEEVKSIVEGIETTVKMPRKGKRYNSITVKSNDIDGRKGKKIFQFVGDNEPFPSKREHRKDEERMSKEYNESILVTYINAEWLRKLIAIWDVDVMPEPENDSQMMLLMFLDNIQRVAGLFGVEVFKQDYILQRIASKMNEDYDKIFNIDEQAMAQKMIEQMKGSLNNPAEQTINAQKGAQLQEVNTM